MDLCGLSGTKSRSRCNMCRHFGLNTGEGALASGFDIGKGSAVVFVGDDCTEDAAVEAEATDDVDENDLAELADVDRDVWPEEKVLELAERVVLPEPAVNPDGEVDTALPEPDEKE